jgi:20S proteasome alpha/beta subunit
LDVGDATHLAIKALKNSFDGELTYRNIEVGIIKTSDPEKRFHVLTQDEIKDLLREVE